MGDDTRNRGRMSTRRFSTQLSPTAKKRLMFADGAESDTVVIEFAPTADTSVLRGQIEGLGGTVLSLTPETRLMNVTLPLLRLDELAETAGVSYVSMPERYSS